MWYNSSIEVCDTVHQNDVRYFYTLQEGAEDVKNPLIGFPDTAEFDRIITENVYPDIIRAFGSIARKTAPETDAVLMAASQLLADALGELCRECGRDFLGGERNGSTYEQSREYADSILRELKRCRTEDPAQ